VIVVRVRLYLLLLLIVAGFGGFGVAGAESLIIDRLNAAQAAEQPHPVRGMSMEDVEATWGKPVSRQAPVGDPPIARWEYPRFVVYFEFNYVIHSVEKPRPRN